MPFAEDSNHVKFSLWEKQFLNEKRHGTQGTGHRAQGTGRKNGLRRAAGGKSAGYRGRSCGLAVLRSCSLAVSSKAAHRL